MKIQKLERYIFLALIFTLPFNLGKHFVFDWAYINGFLVDYLIPTIYIQELLIILLLVSWTFRIIFEGKLLKDLGWDSRLLFIFVLVAFLSVPASINSNTSLVSFIRLLIYVLFGLYVAYNLDIKKDLPNVLKALMVSVFLVEVLALFQWLKQGSVFNNYLILGEQPYSFSTFRVAREQFFGQTIVPVYGTFRHPNIFGGFLSVVLLWFVYFRNVFKVRYFRALTTLVFALGFLILLLTFSLSAVLALVVGALVLLAREHYKIKKTVLLLILVPFVVVSFLLPPFTEAFFSEYSSFFRRSELHVVAVDSIKESLLFGHGINTGAQQSAFDFDFLFEVRQPQPVHNIYLLMAVELGIFALLIFATFLIRAMLNSPPIIFASLFQFAFIGLFDHYIITIHQTSLLFWLTVGIYLGTVLTRGESSRYLFKK
jgi:O-antigen ligase